MLSVGLWQQRFGSWLRQRSYAERTVHAYTRELGPFFEFCQGRGAAELADVTRDLVEEYRTHLYYLRHKDDQPLTASTQQSRLGAVLSFLRFCYRQDHLAHDPGASVERVRARSPLPLDLPGEAEIERLLEAPDVTTPSGIRDRAMLELLYGTGLRNEELCCLLVDDVDLVRRQLIVQSGRPRGQGRLLPLSDECAFWLGRYLDQARPQLAHEGEQRLFLSTQRRPMERGSLIDIVRRNARKAGLERRITPHTLRHCCAAHMLRHRAGLRHIQELLGHASADSTQRYTRLEVSDLRRVLRRCHPREQRR